MSSLGSPNPFFIAGKKAYEIERSLRFNDNDSPYFDFTPSGAGSNQMTFSFWIKRANLVDGVIFSSGTTNARGHIYFSSNQLYVQPFNSTGANGYIVSDMLFRDTSAWYHIVISLNNTTYSNMSSTINIYVNGSAITFTTSTTGAPSGGNRFNDSQAKHIGQFRPQSGSFFDGYLAEFNFIDGQVLDQSSFGETDTTTGQWNPKKYIGGYGSNGFYLNFSDNSGTTATTLGKDSSGNGNNWTPNNFATNDAIKDSPTNNFCTLNKLNSEGVTLSEGNLKAVISNATGSRSSIATMGSKSGKWYYEVLYNSQTGDALCVGFTDETYSVSTSSSNNVFLNHSPNVGYYGAVDGFIYYAANTRITLTGQGFTAGDIIGVAADFDNNQVYFYKNGSAISSANPYSYTFSDNFFIPAISNLTSGGGQTCTVNFGQDSTFAGAKTAQGNTDANGKGDFYYSVPSGFKALCSANLPDPTILLPNKHFDTLLYTGTDSAANRTLTGLNFSPDWVWQKRRNGTNWHGLHDSVRGGGKSVYSNSTNSEATNNQYGYISAFTSDGFTWSAGSTNNSDGNETGGTFVSWCWDAGETDGKTYTVTVVSDSGNKYRFDGYGTSAVTLDLAEGGTYIFNYPSAHPFRFSTTADGTHGGGSEYTTGVTVISSTSIQIVVAASTPTLYYYCSSHSGMGGAINTNSTLGSSNFDGAIQSTVKVNATAGFSILTYTGTGSTATVGHGLGVAPEVIILKDRNAAAAWKVLHKEAVSGSYEYFKNVLYLNSNSTFAGTGNSYPWGNTEPTSSVFSLGNVGSESNRSGSISSRNYVAYCFSGVEGYSKFGKYVANGSTDGTFVFTGFRPAFILAKSTYNTEDWYIYDNKRDGFNVTQKLLYANLNLAEGSGSNNKIDFLSNGFKFRSTGAPHYGTNSAGYIYLAFAESPFKNARAR